MTVKELYDKLNASVPAALSAAWDNDGLACLPDATREATRVLVALDITDDVVKKAIDGGFDAIVAHHPLLVRGIKALTEETAVSRKLLQLARAGVAAISLHTRLDAADGGLYAAVSDSYDLSRLTAGLGKDFCITKIDKKPYPCCRTTHHAIDAALRLREEGLTPQQIQSVLVETYDVGVLQCGFEKYPESPVEAKFSIPFTCAAAFVRGRVSRGEFCRELLEDDQVSRIARATRVVADPLFTQRYPKRWGSRMTVALTDGTRRVCQIDDMSGSVAVPLSPRQELDKFQGLVEPLLGPDGARKLADAVLGVDTLDNLSGLL